MPALTNPTKSSALHAFPFLAALCVLSACGTQEPPPPASYTTDQSPIRFAVAQIEFNDQSSLPGDATFIDRRRSEDLAGKALRLLEERLEAGGGEGVARVEIRRASVIENSRATQTGIRGFFTREASAEIDANLDIRVSIVDGFGLEQAFAEAKVGRTRPVLEGTNTLGKETDAQRVIIGVLGQMDNAVEQAIGENLQPYVTLF